jgi:magnesium transporter
MTNSQAATILSDIAIEEDLNGKIRRNVMDTRNALSFLMRSKLLSVSQHEDVKEILRDIDSLDGHTSFLFNKINFQMDATVGFLNVNQNIDLKRLTIISVVFMPVNIIAGIGGMSEFSMMTNSIPWQLAYGCFILVMIAIGLLTFIGLRTFENKRIEKLRSENSFDK